MIVVKVLTENPIFAEKNTHKKENKAISRKMTMQHQRSKVLHTQGHVEAQICLSRSTASRFRERDLQLVIFPFTTILISVVFFSFKFHNSHSYCVCRLSNVAPIKNFSWRRMITIGRIAFFRMPSPYDDLLRNLIFFFFCLKSKFQKSNICLFGGTFRYIYYRKTFITLA